MNRKSFTQRWAWALLAICGMVAGLACWFVLDDSGNDRAIAELERQNDARRRALAGRDELIERLHVRDSATVPADSIQPPSTSHDPASLVRRIDDLTARVSRLEVAGRDLDQRIVDAKLTVPPPQITKAALLEMDEELVRKAVECQGLFDKARRIAATMQVTLEDEFLTEFRIPPPPLKDHKEFLEAWTAALNARSLYGVLLSRAAAARSAPL